VPGWAAVHPVDRVARRVQYVQQISDRRPNKTSAPITAVGTISDDTLGISYSSQGGSTSPSVQSLVKHCCYKYHLLHSNRLLQLRTFPIHSKCYCRPLYCSQAVMLGSLPMKRLNTSWGCTEPPRERNVSLHSMKKQQQHSYQRQPGAHLMIARHTLIAQHSRTETWLETLVRGAAASDQ
jgi:hypothetical protein